MLFLQQFSKIEATSYNDHLNTHNHVLLSTVLLVVHELSMDDISIIRVRNAENQVSSLRRSLKFEVASTKNKDGRIWVYYRISIPNIYNVGFTTHEEAYNVTSLKLLHSIHHTNQFNHFFTTLAETSRSQALTDVTCTDVHISPYQLGMNTTTSGTHSKAKDNMITTYSVLMLVVFLLIVMIGFTRIVYRLNKIKYFERQAAHRVYPMIEMEQLPAATVVMVTSVFPARLPEEGTTDGLESGMDDAVIAQVVDTGMNMDMTAIAYPASAYFNHASVIVPNQAAPPTLRNALSYYSSMLDSQRYIPITPRRPSANQNSLSIESTSTF
jgi:hypothetical protein